MLSALRRPLAAATALFVIATAFAVIGQAASAPPAGAAPTGYVTLSDGTSIAVNVRMPTSYTPGQKYPTVFEMSGYDGGSADGGTLMNDFGLVPVAEQIPGGSPLPTDDSRQLTDLFNGEYVTVHASVRGTGCSSGEFDIFSWRSALDGKEIIDGWPRRRHQLWLPAALDPRRAARVRHRRGAPPRDRPARGPDDGPESPGAVRAQHARQEPHRHERPRAPRPRRHRQRLVPRPVAADVRRPDTETTADYGSEPIRQDRKAWLDHWVRGVNGGFGSLQQKRKTATVFFDMHRDADGKLVPGGRKDARDFPLPDTQWTDWYLHGDGSLSTTKPGAPEPSRAYVHGTKRQAWSYQAGGEVGPPITTAEGPDELSYRSAPVTANTAIAGPITATLFAQSTAPDTEFFVQLIDEGPDGSHTYLQRGLLRASHRAVDVAASQKTPDGRIYRPHHPHTNPTNITPLQTYEYTIEVFPVGHVFRPGHRILVKVHAPPFVDSYYAYVSRSAPGINTILSGPSTPSRIMLPVVPLKDVDLGPELPCGAMEAIRCIAEPNGPVPLPALPSSPALPTPPPATLPPATLPPVGLPPALLGG